MIFSAPLFIFLYFVYRYVKNKNPDKANPILYFSFIIIGLCIYEIYFYQKYFTIDYQDETLTKEAEIFGLQTPANTQIRRHKQFLHLYRPVVAVNISSYPTENPHIMWKNLPVQSIQYNNVYADIDFKIINIQFIPDIKKSIQIDSFKCDASYISLAIKNRWKKIDLNDDNFNLDSCYILDENNIRLLNQKFKSNITGTVSRVSTPLDITIDSPLEKSIKDNHAYWIFRPSLLQPQSDSADNIIQYQSNTWVFEDMYIDEKKNIRIIDINQIGDQQKNYKFNGCDLDHYFTKMLITISDDHKMYLNAVSYNPEYRIPQQCKKTQLFLKDIKFGSVSRDSFFK